VSSLLSSGSLKLLRPILMRLAVFGTDTTTMFLKMPQVAIVAIIVSC